MKQGMSRAGDCYDNVIMESCFGTIKTNSKWSNQKVTAKHKKKLEVVSATTTLKENTLQLAPKPIRTKTKLKLRGSVAT